MTHDDLYDHLDTLCAACYTLTRLRAQAGLTTVERAQVSMAFDHLHALYTTLVQEVNL